MLYMSTHINNKNTSRTIYLILFSVPHRNFCLIRFVLGNWCLNANRVTFHCYITLNMTKKCLECKKQFMINNRNIHSCFMSGNQTQL